MVGLAAEDPAPLRPDARAAKIVATVGADPDSELHRLLEVRVPELIAYQSPRYAQRYADSVRKVLEPDRAAGGGGGAAEAVARQLYKLMAYKDEYEVARLHLDPVERARIVAEFGEGAEVKYQLHPPLLRALGMEGKIGLGRWFDPAFRALRTLRRVRGTPFDPFGRAHVRRVERELPREYVALVERTLPSLRTDYATVVELYGLPDIVRGYEDIKLRNVETFRARVAELEQQLAAAPAVRLS